MKRKPSSYHGKILGRSWTLEVQATHQGLGIVKIDGFATEAASARTHRFGLFKYNNMPRRKGLELFSMQPLAPEYVRRKVSGMLLTMRKIYMNVLKRKGIRKLI